MNFLLECSLRAAVILAVGLIVVLVLRRASAATRHSILAAAVLGAAVLPVITVAVPQWNLELPAGVHEIYGLGKHSLNDPDELRLTTPSAALGWASPTFLDAADTPPHEEGNIKTRLDYLGLFWVAGATLTLLLLVIGWIRLACIVWQSTPLADSAWMHTAEQIARDYGLRRKVRLLRSRHPAMLATWGLLRPKIVLPRDIEQWHEDRMQIVLRHELAHVRRHDWLIQILSELLRAAYWFNPLIWIACTRLRRESEQACDDTVINSGVAGSDYAGHLLDLARTFREPRHAWSPALLMARESTLEQRFKALLNPNLNRRALTRMAIAITGMVFLGITVPLAALRVSAQEVLSLDLPVNTLRAPLEYVAQSVLPAQSQTGSIEGVAVRMNTSEPLSNVHIELNTPGSSISSRTATSGEDGKFAFHDVAPGTYQLVAAREGGYLPAEYGQRTATGRGLLIDLAPGQKTTGVRVAMTQPGSISGRVVDRDGEPIGRAQVRALRTVYIDGERSEAMVASVATDDRGEYRLYWLPPGQYRVSATPQDVRRGWVPVIAKSLETPATFYTLLSTPVVTRRMLETGEIQEEVQVATYFPTTTDPEGASAIEVRPGGNVTGVDIAAVPPARSHRIRGVLINASTGQPVVDGMVRAIPLMGGGDLIGTNFTSSDRNGRFEILGVLPGAYALMATAELNSDRNAMTGHLRVTVGVNDLENISMGLSPSVDIPVRVTIEGQLAGGGGLSLLLRGVPGKSFVGPGGVMPMRPGTPRWNLFNTPQFTMEGVRPGDYTIAFSGMGDLRPWADLPVYVKSVMMGAVDVLNGLLHVDGPVEHPLEIVLSSNASTLEGMVVSEKQESVGNVSVALIPDAPYRTRVDLYKTATTDGSGRFRLSGIAPGSYRVFSWDDVEGWPWQDPEWLRPYEGRGRQLHFEEGIRKSIQLTVIR